MKIYLLSNLDFELTWANGGSTGGLPRQVRALSEHYRHILLLLGPELLRETSDPLEFQVLGPHSDQTLPVGSLHSGSLLPWGWTPALHNFAKSQGLTIHHADLGLIEKINHKRYGAELDRQLELSTFHTTLIDSKDLDKLPEIIATFAGPWLLKAPWGVSGRGQRRGEEGIFTEKDQKWATQTIAREGCLLLEPLIAIDEEYSFHFQLKDEENRSTVQYLGHCRLHSSPEGALRGLEAGPGLQAPPKQLQVGAQKAAESIAELGYFGPLSIDAYQGHFPPKKLDFVPPWEGHSPQFPGAKNDTNLEQSDFVIRPLSEINARITFGRLAIALASGLALTTNQTLRWHHGPLSGLQTNKAELPLLFVLQEWLQNRAQNCSYSPGFYRLPSTLGEATIEIRNE